MEVVHPRVAGIDVHKKVIWVAVRLPGQEAGQRAVTVRRFTAFWRSLQKMAAWLAELGVADAALESTGVYWWPVYHALAGAGIEVCVCNAAHMRNVPGRKRDATDCQQLAELQMHALGHDALPYLREALELSWVEEPLLAEHYRPYAPSLSGQYFNLRKTTIYAGSTEIQKNIISQQILGL